MRKEVVIEKVLSITPGGNHAWVESNIGRIKKPLNAIPKRLLDEFRAESVEGVAQS